MNADDLETKFGEAVHEQDVALMAKVAFAAISEAARWRGKCEGLSEGLEYLKARVRVLEDSTEDSLKGRLMSGLTFTRGEAADQS